MHEPPDATAADVLVQVQFLNLLAKIGARPDPGAFLDDATVHVHDVQLVPSGAVTRLTGRKLGSVERMNSRPLGFVEISQDGEAFALFDFGAADEAADGLCEKQVALQIGGQAVAAKNVGSAGPGEVIERLVRGAHAVEAALVITGANQREDLRKIRRKLSVEFRRSVNDGCLETDRAGLEHGIHEINLAVIVLGEAPLAVIWRGPFADDVIAARFRKRIAFTVS